MSINTKVLSGFMELLPREQREFDRLKSLIESTYKSFGYHAINTPQIERSDVLLAKGGQEADKQMYFVANGLVAKEPNALALRFDLTVPLARYVAEHHGQLSFPQKIYHIGKSHRGERPQKGRFREFYQCDIDIIGKDSLSLNYDAELPVIVFKVFTAMNIGKFTIRVNNRKLMTGFMSAIGIGNKAADVLRIIDKSMKITEESFQKMLDELNVTKEQSAKISDLLRISGTTEEILDKLDNFKIEDEQFNIGLDELKTVTSLMLKMGIDPEYFCIDLSIVRGLDYYTGTVYETTLDDTPIGSICGGGRYENLVSSYSKASLPGVGLSIGLTRLFSALKEHELLPFDKVKLIDVLIVPESTTNFETAFNVANELRAIGKNIDVFLEEISMKKKFQYVSKANAPATIVVREEDGKEVLSYQYEADGEFIKEIVGIDELIRRMK